MEPLLNILIPNQIFEPTSIIAANRLQETTYEAAHNRIGKAYSPSEELLIDDYQQFARFFEHEYNIAKDPLNFLYSPKFSGRRKFFDLVFGGPLAAIVDLTHSVVSAVLYTVISLGQGLRGLACFAFTKGAKTEFLKLAREKLSHAGKSILNIGISAIRLVPVIGVFPAYVVLIGSEVVKMTCEKIFQKLFPIQG